MKKILLIILLLITLCACNEDGKQKADPDERYMYIIEMISEHETFQDSSNYFDIAVEMAKISDGYRYYITIDNPRIAMYDIELLAIEKSVDYRTQMAANVGIFEEKEYHMVPNQSNPDQGYVKGIVASGVSKNPITTLFIFVQFKNSDFSAVRSEYFKLDVSYGEQSE
ncbi:MAG: hypothetical protein IKS54_08000 [Erysipelotrichaceae bacterium]|nr:hypothetical protein [Erysipelotrichaceae bacterium]